MKIPILVPIFSLLLVAALVWSGSSDQWFAALNVYGTNTSPDDVKFDVGFYDKIKKLADESSASGASGQSNDVQYYNVIIVVSRDDGDNRDADDVARENKDAIVKRLESINAINIDPAETLSFVTASMPVGNIIDFAQSGEVYKLGDGELEIFSEVDTARQTIHATSSELTRNGLALDGTGVVVAVLDTGINHSSLNSKVIKHVKCNESSCNTVSPPSNTDATHGTKVAQVIAASGLPTDMNGLIHNGIAPGVELLDVHYGSSMNNATKRSFHTMQALDWSLTNGADIVNNSWGVTILNTLISPDPIFQTCTLDNQTTINLILNEAVDKGMVAVKSAGNEGDKFDIHTDHYTTITNPGCAHNIITVGGIDDRTFNTITMYDDSSRGPTDNTQPRLKPEIVAPATNIALLQFSGNNTMYTDSGTSLAAPQVSATAALLLQAKPDLTPVEIKTALLLGADWQGPIPCTSTQYEQNNPTDNCSYALQPLDKASRNNAGSLGILNNVGFGILNVDQTLTYALERTVGNIHILGDFIDTTTNTKQYSFAVTNTSEPVKIILSWLVHPHGGITEQINTNHAIPNIANLNFTVTDPNDSIIHRAESKYQTNEFTVFTPSVTGDYTITVTGTGLDTIIKPVQNYALASTNSLSPLLTPSTNNPPIAENNTIIVNPNHKESIPIRLFATDVDNDSISFNVSRDPTSGTVSTAEFITNTVSRMLYTFTTFTTNSFEVTPQDGIATGTPATITLKAESLPSHTDVSPSSDKIRQWDTLEITKGFVHEKYSETFLGPIYPVSALHVGSVNMEGVDIAITTNTGATHTMAIPSSGTRMIELESPIIINSITLSADGIDEEAGYILNQDLTLNTSFNETNNLSFNVNDVRMFVGYVPHSCSVASGGASGGASVMASSCPTDSAYSGKSNPNSAIPDNTDTMSTANTISVPINGTITAISTTVDIPHTYIGDLIVTLTAPDGTQVTLHNREGGSSNDIQKTYSSSSHTSLASLRNSSIAGNWTLSVGDYAGGDIGILKEWSLDMSYSLPLTIVPPITSKPIVVFSDDFESLTNWTESGEGDWIISTSQTHSVPTIPDHTQANTVLHSDNCDTKCTVELTTSIDLTQYSSADLSFWRFVDSGLDRDEYLKVELYNGTSWNPIYHWSHNLGGDDNTWHLESYNLESYLNTNNFKIKIVTQQSSSREDVQLDDVTITATSKTTTTPPTTPIVTPPPPTVTPPPTTSQYSIYVANTDDREVLVYSSTGALEGTIIPARSGGLGKAWDLAFGPDGHLYVTDNTYNKIRKYNGTTGASMGSSSSDAQWASTSSYPYGLDWNGNTLYVATSLGVERFSSSGTSLGFFGDAHRNSTNFQAALLINPYDVVFCSDGRMYVSDRSGNQIVYYSASNGSYLGTIQTSSLPNTPDTRRATGLDCGSAIIGTGNSLYQSGDDGGQINEINLSTGALVREFNSLVDEPYGMDMDSLGNLYVTNKDDDNVIKITSGGTTSVLISGGLDDPRGLEIGPVYASASSASSAQGGASGTIIEHTQNDSPEFVLLQKEGIPIVSDLIPVSPNISLTVSATDPDNDPITIEIIPDTVPNDAISVTDHKDGTATISLDTSELIPATYVFWIMVSDDHDNYDREPYVVIIP